MSTTELVLRVLATLVAVILSGFATNFLVKWALELTRSYFSLLDITIRKTGRDPSRFITIFIWGILIVGVLLHLALTWLF